MLTSHQNMSFALLPILDQVKNLIGILQKFKKALTIVVLNKLTNRNNNKPAICLTSGTVRSRNSTPSNFFIVENMILEMFKLRPMPMASLATRTSSSLLASLNLVACSAKEHINSANHLYKSITDTTVRTPEFEGA